MLRAATDDDLAAVIALARAEETDWFGKPENSAAEVAEWLGYSGGVARGVVVDDDGRIRGFATISPDGDTALVVDSREAAPAYDELVAWLREGGAAHLEAYSADAQRLGWLEAHGWRHARSAFDLVRPGADPVEPPTWPDAIDMRAFDQDADAVAVHHLVYVEAKWAEVPGHTERPFETWVAIFATPGLRAWVARRGSAPVGWVVGRVSDDGRGLIYQIAVAKDERGNGLGRALLLHAYTDLLARGATSLGLSVQAANDKAIGLYTSVGLGVDKEWRIFEPA